MPEKRQNERTEPLQFYYEIPASFWSLFRSVNRDVYIEALLAVNDE